MSGFVPESWSDPSFKNINASGKLCCLVLLIHIPILFFAQAREEEFVMRIKGHSYEEIAEAGGGILNSARRLGLMSEDDLFEKAKVRLNEVIGFGTGAIEIKVVMVFPWKMRSRCSV